MKKTLFQKLIILLFVLSALACALTGQEEPTPTPPPTVAPTEAATEVPPTVPPTDIPPTATPEPEPTVDLTTNFVTYTSPETGITVQHPSDWAVQDFFILLFATDESLFDAPGAIQDGAAVVIASGPADEFENTDPVDLVSEAVAEFDLSDDATIVEGPTALTIQGQTAAIAKIEGTPEETGIPLVGLAVVVVNGDQVAVGLGITLKDLEAEYLPTIEAMFNTIEVSEPVEEPEITTDPPTLEDADMVSVGDNLVTTLDENGNQDFFFEGTADQPVTFTFEPSEDTTDLVVEIFDADLNSILREDTHFSGESEVVIFTPDTSATYFIRVSDFYGEPGGLNVTVVAGAVHPTETITETLSLETGQLTAGTLTGKPINYTFTGSAGISTTILLLPTDDWDPTLTLLGTDGTVLVEEVDEGFSEDPEALVFTPEVDGEYILKVDAFSNPNGNYNLYIFPENSLTASGSVPEGSFQDYRFCVPANASLILAVIPVGTMDLVLTVTGPDGGQLIDSIDGGGIGDPEAFFFEEASGTGAEYAIILSVKSYDGQSGDFTLYVSSTSAEESVILDGC